MVVTILHILKSKNCIIFTDLTNPPKGENALSFNGTRRGEVRNPCGNLMKYFTLLGIKIPVIVFFKHTCEYIFLPYYLKLNSRI